MDYSVSLKRKREAIKVTGHYIDDRTGTPAPAGPCRRTREVRVVPFGNCSGPPYLPAIEDHVTALKADRVTATDVDAFVFRNLDEQITAFANVAGDHAAETGRPARRRTRQRRASRILRKPAPPEHRTTTAPRFVVTDIDLPLPADLAEAGLKRPIDACTYSIPTATVDHQRTGATPPDPAVASATLRSDPDPPNRNFRGGQPTEVVLASPSDAIKW